MLDTWSSLIQLPSATIEAEKYSLQYLYWNRLSTINLFSKNRMHRVLELELEQTYIDYAMF